MFEFDLAYLNMAASHDFTCFVYQLSLLLYLSGTNACKYLHKPPNGARITATVGGVICYQIFACTFGAGKSSLITRPVHTLIRSKGFDYRSCQGNLQRLFSSSVNIPRPT